MYCFGRISCYSVSDTLPSSYYSVSSGVVVSALPCRLLSLLHSSFSCSWVCSYDLSLSLCYIPISHLTSSSCSVTVCMSPSMRASSPAQSLTLPHASLACAPSAQRKSLAKRRRHTSPITTGLTPWAFVKGEQPCYHNGIVGRPGRLINILPFCPCCYLLP